MATDSVQNREVIIKFHTELAKNFKFKIAYKLSFCLQIGATSMTK